MKHKTLLLAFAAAFAFGLAGCGKNEPATTTADDANKTASSAADAADKTAEAAKVEAAKVAEATKAEAAKTAEAAKVDAAKTAEAAKVAEGAKAVAAANYNKVQELIDKAKGLVDESKFSDASSVLQQLTGKSLTSEQQKIVDGLKEQIQKALAANAAAGAAGVATDPLNQ